MFTFFELVDEFSVFRRLGTGGVFYFEKDLLNELDRSLVEIIEFLVWIEAQTAV